MPSLGFSTLAACIVWNRPYRCAYFAHQLKSKPFTSVILNVCIFDFARIRQQVKAYSSRQASRHTLADMRCHVNTASDTRGLVLWTGLAWCWERQRVRRCKPFWTLFTRLLLGRSVLVGSVPFAEVSLICHAERHSHSFPRRSFSQQFFIASDVDPFSFIIFLFGCR